MTKDELKPILKSSSILFVDDEEFVVETMKDILPMLFGNCFFAHNGLEGLEIFKHEQIDIVITDVSMPKMNGIEMLEHMVLINPNLKSICISGHNEKNYLERTSNLGSKYIIKPINSAELYKALIEIYE